MHRNNLSIEFFYKLCWQCSCCCIFTKKINNEISREILAEENYEITDLRKVDVQITRLRQKIEKNPKKPLFIQTVRGKGYKLISDE